MAGDGGRLVSCRAEAINRKSGRHPGPWRPRWPALGFARHAGRRQRRREQGRDSGFVGAWTVRRAGRTWCLHVSALSRSPGAGPLFCGAGCLCGVLVVAGVGQHQHLRWTSLQAVGCTRSPSAQILIQLFYRVHTLTHCSARPVLVLPHHPPFAPLSLLHTARHLRPGILPRDLPARPAFAP